MRFRLRHIAVCMFASGIIVACQKTPDEPTSRHDDTPVVARSTSAPTVSASATVPIPPMPASTGSSTGSAMSGGVRGVANCPVDPEASATPSPIETTHIGLREAGTAVEAEFVRTPRDTERGLMYRRELAEERAMLFLLPRKVQTFWMHNTCIALDMIFAEKDGTIVGVVQNAAPMTDDVRTVGLPSSFVLEVAAGYAARHGVKAGQHLNLPKNVASASARAE